MENIFCKPYWNNKGLSADGKYLNHLKFSDDIALIAHGPEELQQLINELEVDDSCKTKVMRNELIDAQEITINNTTLELTLPGTNETQI